MVGLQKKDERISALQENIEKRKQEKNDIQKKLNKVRKYKQNLKYKE